MARKRSVILSGAKNLAKGDRRGELRDQEEAVEQVSSAVTGELAMSYRAVILSGDWARTGPTRPPRRILGGASDRSREPALARRMNLEAPPSQAAQFIARGCIALPSGDVGG